MPHYSGHRERLRARFEQAGADAFDHRYKATHAVLGA
jgi:hypothetical protein